MPKLKTHKGAAKRFRLTATGKVKRGHSHARHILTKKTNKRKRLLDIDALVADGDLKLGGIELDRKILADFAAKQPDAFAELATQAKSALEKKPQARAAA